ncbi:MAG: thermosome subunit, partial [Thermoplasmata archaeon]|nr:thermosome subunit [Thermoplasmata archaeon]
MLGSGYPVVVLKEGTTRESGRSAQEKNIMVAQAIAEAVRSTLGPKGSDKMLVDSLGDVVITNDGATILKELEVEHPTAKMIIEVAKAQDQESKDGTVTSVILTSELLKNAGELMAQKVHPTIILDGYRMAAEKAVEILRNMAREVKPDDAETLKKVAETAMTGKISDSFKEYLAELAVEAVRKVMEEKNGRIVVDIDNIKVEKKQGGSIKDSRIIEGVILDKEVVHPGMPKEVKDARILLLNQGLEVKKTEVDATIRITSPDQLQAFLDEEEKMLRDMVEKIKSSGANVVLCQKGIDDLAQHFLAKAGIYAVRRVKKSDMEKL